MITHTEAESQTFKIFLDEVKLSAPSILGYLPKIFWHNVEKADKPDITKYYLRAMFEVIDSEQTAFGSPVVGSSRLYSNEGTATFAIYTPPSVAGGDRNAKLLAEKLKSAFRKPVPKCHIWFRRQRIQATYPEDGFLRTNFKTDFYFTEDD